MPPLFGSPGSPIRRYVSRASELNSKFESDYKDCLNVLEREKLNPVPASGSDGDHQQQSSLTDNDVPTEISASKDRATRQEMLRRTKSNLASHSTTTQKMFVASEENGIVVTSTRNASMASANTRNSSTGDASTLPTFLSVGSSLNWHHDQQDCNKLYLVSKESSHAPPHLTPVSLESPTSRTRSGDSEKENKKRLQYKEKLRSLTERLTTSAAVERSRKMLSDIKENGLIPERDEVANNNNGNNNHNNSNTPVAPGEEHNSPNNTRYRRIYDGIKKNLYACSMSMCVDDSVVDHEGLIIAVPRCRCTEEDVNFSTTEEDDYDMDENTAVSSLTGVTNYRFQSRYWMNNSRKDDNEMMWI